MKRLHVLRRIWLRRIELRPVGCLLTLGLSLLVGAGSVAGARPVIVGGVPTSPVIETKPLSNDHEGLPVWFLPRLGVQTRNDPQDLWLSYGTRSLRYTPQGGWQASGFTLSRPLSAPERYGEGSSLHVTLDVLRSLGLVMSGSAEHLDMAARRVAVEVPEVPAPQLSVLGVLARAPVATRPATARPPATQPPATQPTVKLTLPSKPTASRPETKIPEPSKSEGQQPPPLKLPPTPTASIQATALPGAPALSGAKRAAPTLPGVAVLTPPRRTSAAPTNQAITARTRLAQIGSTQIGSTQIGSTQTNSAQGSQTLTSTLPAQAGGIRVSTVTAVVAAQHQPSATQVAAQSRLAQTSPAAARPAQTGSAQTGSAQTGSAQTGSAQPPPAPTPPVKTTPTQPSSVQTPRTRPTPLAQANPEPEVPAPVQPAPVPAPAPTPTPQPTPPPALSGPHITGVRSSLSSVRNVQLQRLVIDLSGPGSYSAVSERGGVTVFLPGATAAADVQTLESGDTLTLAPDGRGVTVRLDANGGQSQVTALGNPDRLVIDTSTSLNADVPPPINEEALPGGITLRTFGGLSLLSFDPARYAPHVATAPVGSALSVSELVRRNGGVAGVNGGYFDPPSGLPVDFVAAGGLLLSASLERRGTVGFAENGEPLFGFPRPRYTLSGSFGSLNANTVSARSNPNLLTAFVGDGHTAVGGSGLITLTLNTAASSVLRTDAGGTVPAAGLISLSFDPARFPQLPRTPGSELSATLNYQSQPWQGVREGLSAGPMLIQGGVVVLNAEREAFNVLSGVWRPTRQVAFAVYRGQPTLAFLEFGTPDTFARALHSAGVQDALRLDSGSSATVFVTGGYLGTGGYLNSVWSRPVPNAIVLVPVDNTRAIKANKGK